MSQEKPWDDAAREGLRETLRSAIVGELRLGRRPREQIVEWCREVYLRDESPEPEVEKFLRFTADELDRSAAALAAEQVGWPKETDCDRLDRVEAALRDRGILFWQASPCCDTCAIAEIPDRINEIEDLYPGFRDRVRGDAFFIEQNMPERLADGTEIKVYLSYGWFSPDGKDVEHDVYMKHALGIAHEVCKCLRDEGFEVDWNGDFSRTIGLSMNWQRRTVLE